MSEHTSRLYYNSEEIKFADVERILKLANATLGEYVNDLNGELTEMDIDVLKTILYIYSPEKEMKHHEHVLFKDVVYCACGNGSTRKKTELTSFLLL